MAFYLFNPRLSVLATIAWFRAWAGALDQQGAAHFPKNVTLPCLSAKKEHKDFLLTQKALTALPDLISVFVSCYVWGTKRTWLGVWASTHRRVSSTGSLSFSLVLHMLEERRKCRRNQTQANRFSNSHHTRMFTHFFFLLFFLQSPCRTATPRRYLRHLHSSSHCEPGKSFHVSDASIDVWRKENRRQLVVLLLWC